MEKSYSTLHNYLHLRLSLALERKNSEKLNIFANSLKEKREELREIVLSDYCKGDNHSLPLIQN